MQSKFASAIFIAMAVFVAGKGIIYEPFMEKLLRANLPPYLLSNLSAPLFAVSILAGAASFSAKSRIEQEHRNSQIELWHTLFVCIVAIFAVLQFDFTPLFPRSSDSSSSEEPIPSPHNFATPPVLPSTPSGLNDAQTQEVISIVGQIIQQKFPDGDISPEQLLDLLNDQFKDKYGFDLEEVKYCLIGPSYSSVSVRPQAYVNEHQNPRGYLYRNDIALAIAHSGGVINNDLWWFINTTDKNGQQLTGWVSSTAVEEMTLGCELLKRNVQAYLGTN